MGYTLNKIEQLEIEIEELKKMNNTKLLVKNAKMNKTNRKEGVSVFNYGIPAYKSERQNMITCPMAKDCVKPCYARQGTYTWTPTKNAYENRLEHYFNGTLTSSIMKEIKSKRRITHVRVHDSGDFFSKAYLANWIRIAENHPEVVFYAYTKTVSWVKELESLGLIPKNFIFIFSYGGYDDHLIDPEKDRHSKVFKDSESLPSTYVNASDNDLLAIGENKNIGLIYHGYKKNNVELKGEAA